MRGCGGCWMRREQHHDALHDRRPAGLQGERGVGLGQATPRDVPGVPGRARGTVPTHCVAQGVAGAPAGPGPAAGGIALLLLVRPSTGPAGRGDAAELQRVKQQSATLEAELERYDPDRRVTSGRTAALAAALEDRIAVIDGELAQVGTPEAPVRGAELVKLWQERVDAMQQLMTVHVTRAAYVGL